MKRLGIVLSAVAILLACQTAPPEIPQDASQAELIQSAQEAADQEHWDAALAYYNAIVDRFPQDRAATATARYEIAFIHYRLGDLETAKAGFEQLLAMYEFEAEALPAWPQVLWKKIMSEIDAQLGDTPPATDASGAQSN